MGHVFQGYWELGKQTQNYVVYRGSSLHQTLMEAMFIQRNEAVLPWRFEAVSPWRSDYVLPWRAKAVLHGTFHRNFSSLILPVVNLTLEHWLLRITHPSLGLSDSSVTKGRAPIHGVLHYPSQLSSTCTFWLISSQPCCPFLRLPPRAVSHFGAISG